MQEFDYRVAAIKLWNMLDDIDTYSDLAKSNDKFYRELVENKQKERMNVFKSDGYNLFIDGLDEPIDI